MGGGYLTNPLVFLVQVLCGAYALIVMLRFLLQLVRADFHNPVSQFVVRLTTPLLRPMRRVIPAAGRIDTSSLLLAWLVSAIELLLIMLILGRGMQPLAALLGALPLLTQLAIHIFLFSILIQVILSWVGGGYNPAASVIHSLTEPLLAPARRLLPPIGGLDLSPMAAMVGLVLLEMLLIPPLEALVATLTSG
ncbi:MAG: YggT family protein [Candidatus Sedimenticola endophacoides]